MNLRPATDDDVAAVRALEVDLFGVDAWSETSVREELLGERRTAVVACDPEVVGYVVTAAAGDVVDLQRVAVREDHRRSGLARRLLRGGARRPTRRMLLEVSAAQRRGAAVLRRRGVHRDRPTAPLLPRRLRRRGDAARAGRPAVGWEDAGMSDEPLVLGIETSCDETGVGIVRGRTLLADAVASSVEEHARFGGVVPEVASRAHLEAMVPTIERACETAGIALRDVDAIAVTNGPGLAGALLVGVAAAKALAVGLGKPLYGVNHLASHVAVDQLEHGPLPEPCVAMLVSGGHSSLLRVTDVTGHDGGVAPLGSTIDDAAGEAFDKVARLLGLPFPGGPHVDRAARSGSSVAIDFPRGLTSQRDLQRHRFDFSFSGLKTAVARWVEARERAGEPVPVEDVAASFQEAVCDVLTRKAVDAAVSEGIEDILVGGGVAANSRLRVLVEERAAARGIRVRVPRPGLCTDNGAMVAALGAEMVARGRQPSALDLPADSSLPVTSVLA